MVDLPHRDIAPASRHHEEGEQLEEARRRTPVHDCIGNTCSVECSHCADGVSYSSRMPRRWKHGNANKLRPSSSTHTPPNILIEQYTAPNNTISGRRGTRMSRGRRGPSVKCVLTDENPEQSVLDKYISFVEYVVNSTLRVFKLAVSVGRLLHRTTHIIPH